MPVPGQQRTLSPQGDMVSLQCHIERVVSGVEKQPSPFPREATSESPLLVSPRAELLTMTSKPKEGRASSVSPHKDVPLTVILHRTYTSDSSLPAAQRDAFMTPPRNHPELRAHASDDSFSAERDAVFPSSSRAATVHSRSRMSTPLSLREKEVRAIIECPRAPSDFARTQTTNPLFSTEEEIRSKSVSPRT